MKENKRVNYKRTQSRNPQQTSAHPEYSKKRDKSSTKSIPLAVSHSKVKGTDRIRGYFSHHRWASQDSLMRLLRTPIASLITWLVLAIALTLPTAMFVLLKNAQFVSGYWDGAPQISLYLTLQTNDKNGHDLANELQAWDGVIETRYISREQALEEFQSMSGYGDVINQLDENPLPAVIMVRPNNIVADVDGMKNLLAKLQKLPEIEFAELDLSWVKRLSNIITIGQRVVLILACLLALSVLLVIGNTIRLAIENRREEIVVNKLVGATNGFVRRPFLYTGIWFGLGGGLLAWVMVNVSLAWLGEPIQQLMNLYHSDVSFSGLGGDATLGLLAGSCLLGWLGAWLAVAQHLRNVESR